MTRIDNLRYDKMHWHADWNGDEVGYDNVSVIGLYSIGDMYMYIDIENDSIVEAWFYDEEDYTYYSNNMINDEY